MNTKPLENIMKIYKDKNKIFETYLTTETLTKLKNRSFYDKNKTDIYLNDNITFVKKNTCHIYKSGKVIAIDETKITIKTVLNYITLDSEDYYLFIKQKSKKNAERDFYKVLFNNL